MGPGLLTEIIGILFDIKKEDFCLTFSGNVGVVLFNFGRSSFKVQRGDRIAQLICEKAEQPNLLVVSQLNETRRNVEGFGSTDTKT